MYAHIGMSVLHTRGTRVRHPDLALVTGFLCGRFGILEPWTFPVGQTSALTLHNCFSRTGCTRGGLCQEHQFLDLSTLRQCTSNLKRDFTQMRP